MCKLLVRCKGYLRGVHCGGYPQTQDAAALLRYAGALLQQSCLYRHTLCHRAEDRAQCRRQATDLQT